MVLAVIRLSWYLNDPDEENSDHYQKAFDPSRVDGDDVMRELRERAYFDGILTSPRRILRIPDWC